MTLELSAEEVLTTTRSVRRRLNLEKEVSVEVLRDCLDIALQAPTGSLRQDWHFVVSTDRDQCREVGTIYQEVWTAMVTDEYLDASASKQGEESDRASWLNMMVQRVTWRKFSPMCRQYLFPVLQEDLREQTP